MRLILFSLLLFSSFRVFASACSVGFPNAVFDKRDVYCHDHTVSKSTCFNTKGVFYIVYYELGATHDCVFSVPRPVPPPPTGCPGNGSYCADSGICAPAGAQCCLTGYIPEAGGQCCDTQYCKEGSVCAIDHGVAHCLSKNSDRYCRDGRFCHEGSRCDNESHKCYAIGQPSAPAVAPSSSLTEPKYSKPQCEGKDWAATHWCSSAAAPLHQVKSCLEAVPNSGDGKFGFTVSTDKSCAPGRYLAAVATYDASGVCMRRVTIIDSLTRGIGQVHSDAHGAKRPHVLDAILAEDNGSVALSKILSCYVDRHAGMPCSCP